MDDTQNQGSFALLPVSGGGALIVSVHPAGLPGHSMAEALSQYQALGAAALLSLTTEQELVALNLATLPALCKAQGLQWWHAPIQDMGEPDASFEQWWRAHQGALHGLLDDGHALAMHCWSGYGRSGTVAARVLIERGMTPEKALAYVREHRPGAVETAGQADYVLGLSGSR